MIAGMCGFAGAQICSKVAFGMGYHPQDTLLMGGIFLTSYNLIWVLKDGVNYFKLPKKLMYFILQRGVVGALAQAFLITAVTWLPVSIASLLYNMSPLFMVVLAPLFVGEKITCFNISANIGAFFGVALVSIGTKLVGDKIYPEAIAGIIIAIVSAVFSSMGALSMKQVGLYKTHTGFCPLSMGIFMIVCSYFI